MPSGKESVDAMADDKDEIVKSIFCDDRLDAYKPFFDHPWAGWLSDKVRGTTIDFAVSVLLLEWKATSLAFCQPWLTQQMLKNYAEGFTGGGNESLPIRWVAGMRENLVERVNLTVTQKNKLREEINKAYELAKKAVVEPVRFDFEETWQDFLNNKDYLLAIASQQKLCFGSLYYAYEDWLSRCVALTTARPAFTLPSGKKATKELQKAFGEEASAKCWTDSPVYTAREVRHAVVHNGGRNNEKLREAGCTIRVSDEGDLLIAADDTRSLYTLLSDRVSYLVDLILTMQAS